MFQLPVLTSDEFNHKGTAAENLDRNWDRVDTDMFSTEQRRVAIQTFIKYDHSYVDTVVELGYLIRKTLGLW